MLCYILKRSLLVLLLVILCLKISLAQKGDYFVTNFKIESERIDHPYFDLDHYDNSYIYVAHRSGILIFDGYRWERVNCESAIYSLSVDKDEIIVGGKTGFGKIILNSNNIYEYLNLSIDIPESENIFEVEIHKEKHFFLNESTLFYIEDNKINNIKIDSIAFNGMYLLDDKLIVYSENSQYEFIENRLEIFEDLTLPSNISFINNDDVYPAILAANNKIYMKTGNTFTPFALKDEGYLADNIITSSEWINEKLLAVGTLKGGVVFFDVESGDLIQIVNSHTGLTDNEVLAVLRDKDGGLWVAQNNGLDRVAPLLPMSNFTNYPGLSGSLSSTFTHKNNLYVSTSLGLYILDDVKDYKEIVKFIKPKNKAEEINNPSQNGRENSKKKKKEKEIVSEDEGEKKDKKGLFGLFKKRKKNEEENLEEEEEKKDGNFLSRIFSRKSKKETDDSITLQKSIFKELISVRYLFKPVDGIDSKTSHFAVSPNGKLLNGGLDGLYEIVDDKSFKISGDAVRYFIITTDNILVVSFNSGEIGLFNLNQNEKWEFFGSFDLDGDVAFHILEDKDYLWFSSIEFVYKADKKNNFEMEKYDIKNPYSDTSYGTLLNDTAYFVNPTGYYFYNPKENILQKNEKMDSLYGSPQKYIIEGKNIWVYNNSTWKNLNKSSTINELLLNLVPNLKSVHFDKVQNAFWIIGFNNKLFKIENIESQIASNYSLALKNIQTKDIKIRGVEDKITLDQRDGNLIFEYVQPDYAGVLGIKYRYFLEGLNQDWSEWSDNNIITFPYLPSGEYIIRVQTRDIFGQVNQSPEITLKVVPPYWQRPWFYGMEVFIVASLLFLSIRLNKSPNKRYIFLNRLIAFLTLILIVEFIQAIAESKFQTKESPVIDFFIQVFIAGAVLPVEHFLRKWLTEDKSIEPKKVDAE